MADNAARFLELPSQVIRPLSVAARIGQISRQISRVPEHLLRIPLDAHPELLHAESERWSAREDMVQALEVPGALESHGMTPQVKLSLRELAVAASAAKERI